MLMLNFYGPKASYSLQGPPMLNPWVAALNEVLGLLICIVCNILVYTGR